MIGIKGKCWKSDQEVVPIVSCPTSTVDESLSIVIIIPANKNMMTYLSEV